MPRIRESSVSDGSSLVTEAGGPPIQVRYGATWPSENDARLARAIVRETPETVVVTDPEGPSGCGIRRRSACSVIRRPKRWAGAST
jgi:hypothetical protein